MIAQRGHRALWRRPGSMPFIRKWGDVKRIARACGVTVQAVSLWKRVPERHLAVVADLLGVTPEQLRPDLVVRNMMMKDVDPRDARRGEDMIADAVRQLEEKRLAVLTARAERQRCVASVSDAELALGQADSRLKRARTSLARARQTFLHAGIPAHRLDAEDADVVPPPLSPVLIAEVGGVKS